MISGDKSIALLDRRWLLTCVDTISGWTEEQCDFIAVLLTIMLHASVHIQAIIWGYDAYPLIWEYEGCL